MEPQDRGMRVTSSSFEKYLKVNVTLLRVFGLLPLSSNATVYDKVFDIFKSLAIPAMINVVVIPNVLTLFNEHLDPDIIMESLSGCTESGGLQIKYIILLLRRNQTKKIIKSCQNLWETDHPRGYEILSRYVKRGYILTWVFLCVLNITATCFGVLPFLLESNGTDHTLPVSPGFVINSTFIYKMTSSAQCIVTCTCGFIIVAVDSLLPILLINSCGQFKLIRAVLDDINEIYEATVIDESQNEEMDKFLKSKIDECILRHQRLLAHYEHIEENFHLYSLVQMFIGLYTIALGLFNLSMGTKEGLKYVTILMTGVIQILICNWSPEKVYEESNMTNLAVYNLPWYRESFHTCRTTLSVFLMMTQHPIRLSAGRFIDLSMKTFSTVLTDAISFLTVLRTLTQTE